MINIDKRFKMARSDEALSDLPISKHRLYLDLLDGQEKYTETIYESTTTSQIDKMVSVFIPAIKKISRDSFIEKIVGIQPIQDRIALINYMDYEHAGDLASVNPYGGDVAAAGTGDVTNVGTTQTSHGTPQSNKDGGNVSPGDSVFDTVTTKFSRDRGEMKSIDRGLQLVVRQHPVTAESRKLKGLWSFEAQDSVDSMGIRLEEEITRAMSSKIMEEINYEVLDDLYFIADSLGTWEAPMPVDSPLVQERKEKDLFHSILDASAKIYDRTRRHPNYVIMNPFVNAYLKRFSSFQGYTSGSEMMPQSINRIFHQGVLNQEYMVIVVPNMRTNDILIGYKGNTELEAGYIYCPYRPLIVMNSQYNVDNWTWVRSVGSFYAKAPDILKTLYGKISVTLPSTSS